MASKKQIYEFAIKWCKKFKNQNTDYVELLDRLLTDDYVSVGFKVDCGHAFSEKYGLAAEDCKALTEIIDEVTDVELLGSAVFSRWRYFNHWAYDGAAILESQNREWFIIALSRIAELTNEN